MLEEEIMSGSNSGNETKDENPSNPEGNGGQNVAAAMNGGARQNSSSNLGSFGRQSANGSPALGIRSDTTSILDFDDWSQDPFTAAKEGDVFAPFEEDVQGGSAGDNNEGASKTLPTVAAPTHDALPQFPPAGVLVPTASVTAQSQLPVADPNRKRGAPEPAPALSNSTPAAPPSNTKSVFSRRKKKPKGMPKRPLSAYNLYFQAERGRILEQQAKQGEKATKIGFEGLGKIIGKQWKKLSNADKKQYEVLAEKDGERYRKEMDAYNDLKSKQLEEEVSRPLSSNPQFASALSMETRHSSMSILQGAPSAHTMLPHSGGTHFYATTLQGMHDPAPAQANEYKPTLSLCQPPAAPSLYARDRASSADGAPAPSPATALSFDERGTPSHSHHPSPAQTPRPTVSMGQQLQPSSYQRYPLPNLGGMPQHGNMPSSFPLPPDMEIVLSDSTGVDRKYRVHYTCYAMTREAAHQYLESLTAGSHSGGNVPANTGVYGGNTPAPSNVASAPSSYPPPAQGQQQQQSSPQAMGAQLPHYGAPWGR